MSEYNTYYDTASNGIDKRIEPLLPDFGYACDVGANNGLFLSNTKLFEQKGWRVLCVEPNPKLVDEGKKNRKEWIQAACGPEDIDAVNFIIVGEYPYAAGSGFHIEKMGELIKTSEIVTVPMRRIDTLLKAASFPRLDLLSIDVEWHELEVLAGIDLNVWTPKIIVVESLSDNMATQLDSFLWKYGYRYFFTQELDRCYRRGE